MNHWEENKLKKFAFEYSRYSMKAVASGRMLKPGLLAATIGLIFARPALAAAPVVVDLAQAKTTATTVCAACHGEDGNSVASMFPKLAGLTPEYLAKQLTEFVSGKRKNDMMSTIAASLKPADIVPLATYYSSLKLQPGTGQDATLVEQGRQLFLMGNETTGVPACGGCHGQNAEGVALVPRLAGQYSDYLLLQLKNFNGGTRTNDPNRFMRVIAQRMTEQEMKAVAEYLSSVDLK